MSYLLSDITVTLIVISLIVLENNRHVVDETSRRWWETVYFRRPSSRKAAKMGKYHIAGQTLFPVEASSVATVSSSINTSALY